MEVEANSLEVLVVRTLTCRSVRHESFEVTPEVAERFELFVREVTQDE